MSSCRRLLGGACVALCRFSAGRPGLRDIDEEDGNGMAFSWKGWLARRKAQQVNEHVPALHRDVSRQAINEAVCQVCV